MKTIDFTKYPMPRMRHHVNPTLYLPYESHHKRPYWYPPLVEQYTWSDNFANSNPPTVLDIGCGRGGFLLQYALDNPHINILGLELRKQAVEWINGVIKGESIENAAAFWYSAVNNLPFIEDNSIDTVFYFFPDPWHKKRHHKRRLFSTEFLTELDRVMKPDACLYLMTDVETVDEYQQESINEHNIFTFRYCDNDEEWNLPRTDQEKFSLRKGIPYRRLIVTKKKK